MYNANGFCRQVYFYNKLQSRWTNTGAMLCSVVTFRGDRSENNVNQIRQPEGEELAKLTFRQFV